MRHLIKTCILLSSLAAVGCGEHDEGFFEGQAEARRARGEYGEVGAQVVGGLIQVMPGRVYEDKSPEWNAGYREGVRQELNR